MPEDNFAEAFDAPHVELIAGQSVEFHRPEMDDYAKWIEEIKAARRKTDTALIPEDSLDTERFNMRRMIERDIRSISLTDVVQQVYTLPGARKVLKLSLRKSGKTDPEADAVIAKVLPRRIIQLAMRASGLFEFKDEKKAEKSDPNSPGVNSPAENETGS